MTTKKKAVVTDVDTALPNPSKWDIIPIHGSDRSAFKACRRRWAWSSPSQRNLVPKAAVHGVREALWYGTGCHHSYERYYNPGLKEDPAVTFASWYDLQWNGGLVKESELKEFIDREPELQKNGTYKVKGLRDLLPFPQEFEEKDYLSLGVGMMNFYKQYAEANDNFEVIATEHDFSVPILDEEGEVFYAEDIRDMPESWEPDFTKTNEFGPLMKSVGTGIYKQVHARGRMDMIIQTEHGYGLMDHKTTSRTDDDYFRGLDLDEQCTTYLTLGEIEAEMFGLPYKELDHIIYQAILKGYPKSPTPLKSGLPSLNRKEETTSAALFEEYIRTNGLTPIFEADPKMQSYYTWLLEKGDERYIVRTPVRRNKAQKANAMKRLYLEACDMLNNPRLYPNPSRDYSCLNCVFRSPCIAAEDGSDWKSMLADGYVENWDR